MNELELMVIAMGEVTVGVDTEQIEGMITLAQADEMGVKVCRLQDKIPFMGTRVRLQAPKALLIKHAQPYAVIVESPQDILSVDLDSIRPLPPLLAACNPCKAVWGVAVRGEGLIFLIDFSRSDGVHAGLSALHPGLSNQASFINGQDLDRY